MAKQNLFTTLLTEAITAGSTSIKVDTGRVQSVNSTLIGEILTIMPLAEIASFTNSEMVKVTGVSGNTLSVTRAQNGTLAKDFAKDSVVVLASTVEDYLIKKNKSILLSCDTAANDSPKVCASSTGSYTPAYGDELIVDFINGCDKDVFTLAVDGMGELLVKIGTENVTTKHISSTTRIQVPMWFDGSFYQIYGSQRNNDTINKLGHGLVASATSSTLSITGGDAIIDGETVLVTSKTLSNTTTAVPTSGVGYIGVNRANQLVVSTTGFQSGVLPVCIIAKNATNQWNPNSLVNYNLTKSGNIDFTTFPSPVSSTTSSITLPAGSWWVSHTMNWRQVSPTAPAVLVYAITGIEGGKTLAVPAASEQNYHLDAHTEGFLKLTSQTTLTKTEPTVTNAQTYSQRWLAIPLLNFTV